MALVSHYIKESEFHLGGENVLENSDKIEYLELLLHGSIASQGPHAPESQFSTPGPDGANIPIGKKRDPPKSNIARHRNPPLLQCSHWQIGAAGAATTAPGNI